MHATAEEEAHQAQLEVEKTIKDTLTPCVLFPRRMRSRRLNKEAECSSEMASLQADLELIAQIKEKMATLTTVDNDILGESRGRRRRL